MCAVFLRASLSIRSPSLRATLSVRRSLRRLLLPPRRVNRTAHIPVGSALFARIIFRIFFFFLSFFRTRRNAEKRAPPTTSRTEEGKKNSRHPTPGHTPLDSHAPRERNRTDDDDDDDGFVERGGHARLAVALFRERRVPEEKLIESL